EAFAFARRYNLFARLQFGPVKDLVRVARALQDPAQAAKLRSDPAFQALLSDPRFRGALGSNGMQQALEQGAYSSLVRSNSVLQLVQDRSAASRMAAAADSVVEGAPPKPAKGHRTP